MTRRDLMRLDVLNIVRPAEGGIKGHVMRLALGSAARGHKVAIACPAAIFPDGSEASNCLTAAGITLIPLSLPGKLSLPGDFAAWARLILILNRARPRVVHMHGFKASLVGRAAAIAFGAISGRRPLTICTIHNSMAGQFGAKSRTWAAIRFVERALARSTDGVIAISGALQREYVELAKPGVPPVVYIPNGIELDRFMANSVRGAGGAQLTSCSTGDTAITGAATTPGPVIGTVARLIPSKGVDVLLCAFSSVLRTFPRARLVVVGDGPMRSGLEALAGHLGISANVAFTGHKEDVPALLGTFDVFVLPSLSEGMSISILEAMASCVPVVATRVGGIPEAVEDGVSGLLVAPSNARELAEAIIRLVTHPDERTRLARRAFEVVTSKFSADRMVEDTCRFYHEVLARKAAASVRRS